MSERNAEYTVGRITFGPHKGETLRVPTPVVSAQTEPDVDLLALCNKIASTPHTALTEFTERELLLILVALLAFKSDAQVFMCGGEPVVKG